MEKLDKNLYDIMKVNSGNLTIMLQKQIVSIFRKLDNIGIFHADPNPLNFMFKNKKLYIIDYGFSKNITPTLIKKYGTKNLNMKFMIIGFIIKMKKIAPNVRYEFFEKYLKGEDKIKFNLI